MTRRNIRQQVHEDIRLRILRGDIGLEDKLVDTAIAAELGVSRMPVREALMQLVSEGYLEGTSRGFALPNLGHEQILEFFLLRRLLEPHAAASAAQVHGKDVLDTMRAAVAETSSTLESCEFEPFFRACEKFRDCWLSSVPNTELRRTIQRYSVQVQSVRFSTMRDPDAHRTIVAGQHELVQTFADRDALAAGDCMLRFVIEGEKSYRKLRGAGMDILTDGVPTAPDNASDRQQSKD